MDEDQKLKEFNELEEEIETILSVKDELSDDEIDNLAGEFNSLSELEIREKISLITGDKSYLDFQVNNSEYITEKKDEEHIDELLEVKEVLKLKELQQSGKIDEVNTESELQYDKDEKNSICNDELIEIKDEVLEAKDNPITQEPEEIEEQPENISVIRGDIQYNQLSLQWNWPKGISKVVVGYRLDKFPKYADEEMSTCSIVERRGNEIEGEFIINKVEQGNYYFSIFPVVQEAGRTKYLEGKHRLIVNKPVIEIYYDLKIKRNLLGKIKSMQIEFRTEEKEVNLPPTVLIAKVGNLPIQKSDGESICRLDSVVLSNSKPNTVELPLDNFMKNMYVKLFMLDDNNGKLFRIISPAREKLMFK
ncbi:MAG: hypothetical protein Q8936_21175 [Bacillota bacterium]|nr:hypothetical protein [Bacillota bacterium]